MRGIFNACRVYIGEVKGLSEVKGLGELGNRPVLAPKSSRVAELSLPLTFRSR